MQQPGVETHLPFEDRACNPQAEFFRVHAQATDWINDSRIRAPREILPGAQGRTEEQLESLPGFPDANEVRISDLAKDSARPTRHGHELPTGFNPTGWPAPE
jgi:hypothetical protein